jgi:hypothetical protein
MREFMLGLFCGVLICALGLVAMFLIFITDKRRFNQDDRDETDA